MAHQQGKDRVNQETEPVLALGAMWSQEFGNAMEAMAGERPELDVHSGAGAGLPRKNLRAARDKNSEGDIVWWKQVFDASPGSAVWIGTPRELCNQLGQPILAAAGIESTDANELRDTYLEVVRQSLGSFASAIGAQISREVVCIDGSEEEPPRDRTIGCEIAISRAGEQLPPLIFLLNKEMLEATARFSPSDAAAEESAATAEPGEPKRELSTRASSTLNLLMDVELPVSVSFGRTRVRMQEILKLITGSIIELDRSISEPVEVIVNNCVVARGEVVVVDGNYGVRINEVMSRSDRLRESRRSLLPLHRTGASASGRSGKANILTA
jgi:flagellar motor switch protein FliN